MADATAPYDQEAVMQAARERERIAIEMRRSGMTYKKIGERMGVTAERARYIVDKGERIERFKRQGLIRKPGGLWERGGLWVWAHG
jgi:DNA-binding CsgD family transcriptional regulator